MKVKDRVINFWRNVLFVILFPFAVFLIIITLGIILLLFESENPEGRYKDDWTLMAEWQEKQLKELKKHERKI